MDILDTNGDLIIGGLPLLIERDITKQYRHLSVPEGTFIVKDNTGKGTQPGQFSFGNTHTLYYVDPTQ